MRSNYRGAALAFLTLLGLATPAPAQQVSQEEWWAISNLIPNPLGQNHLFNSGIQFRGTGVLGVHLAATRTFTSTNPNNLVHHTITIHWGNIRAKFKGQLTTYPPAHQITANHWAGVIGYILIHESFHVCRVSETEPCAKESLSCTHLAIEASTNETSCDLATELKSIVNDPGADPDDALAAQETLNGLCVAMQVATDRWNSTEGVEEANNCLCGTGTCPHVPVPGCDAKLPGMPPGKDCGENGPPFSGSGPVIPACSACQ